MQQINRYPADRIVSFANTYLATVVHRLDNGIHRINRYPADKCQKKFRCYPPDSDLSSG